MWKIRKYKIPLCKSFEIEMPSMFNVVYTREIDNEPYLWAMVDVNSKVRKVRFVAVYTGEEVNPDLFYIDTCIVYGVVLHIFIDEGEEDGDN